MLLACCDLVGAVGRAPHGPAGAAASERWQPAGLRCAWSTCVQCWVMFRSDLEKVLLRPTLPDELWLLCVEPGAIWKVMQ
eukprot:s3334_g8.t1